MIACCGLDCEKCPAFIATINDDEALREQTARQWSRIYRAEILPAQVRCTGCRGEGEKFFYCGHMCEVRRCAEQKGLVHCGQCPGFACELLSPIFGHDPEAKKRLLDLL